MSGRDSLVPEENDASLHSAADSGSAAHAGGRGPAPAQHPCHPAGAPGIAAGRAGLGRLPLAALVGACREEMGTFRRGEPSCEECCFEIVRRAVCEGDQAAWDAVVVQYRGLVRAWIRQHPASSALSEEAEYWVHCAFARFWAAVGPGRFGAFSSLGAVLRYLKLCAHSVLLDEVRRRAATPSEPLSAHEARLEAPAGPDAAVDELAARELWRAIGAALPDETERLVAHLCLALGMRPAEIHARYPERFPTAAAIYRVKRTLLDRLGRSPEVRRFLDE